VAKGTFKNVGYYRFNRIREAHKLAAWAHAGQKRKEMVHGKKLSYLIHPDGVALLLIAGDASENTVCAGYLHDVQEDAGVTNAQIAEQFGPQVAFLVQEMTEPEGESWHYRKSYKIRRLSQGSLELKLLGAADHCDNLWSIWETLVEEGCKTAEDFKTAKVWSQFKQDYVKQKWYHQESCRAIFANVAIEDLHPLFGKYMRLVERIFGEKIITDLAIRRKVRRRKRNYELNFKPNIKRPG
jgi:(p)ppGpp synthase/HD superfamily hydrolase